MSGRRGFSFLETLMAVSILFLVALYCMSMFAQGQRHWLRAQEYSTAVFLANREMQDLLATPFLAFPASGTSGKFEAPFEDYVYGLTLEPFENDMSLLRVEVTSRKGVIVRARTLIADNERFYGIAADPSTHKLAFARGGAKIDDYDDLTGTAKLDNPAAPGGAPLGGLAGQPSSGLLWALTQPTGLFAWKEGTWGPRISLPTAGESARCTGLAATPTGDRVYLGDGINRAIWILHDDEEGQSWEGPLAPTKTPLGAPAGLAVDPGGSVLWIADKEYQCLRKLLLVYANPGYALTDLDTVGENHWHNKRYRPPANVGVLGSPQGLALDPGGWGVLVADTGRLYRFAEGESPEWTVLATFPPALIAAGPSGLAVDPFQDLAFVATRAGQIWRVELGPPATCTPVSL